MKSIHFTRITEYLLSILLAGLAIFLFREVWQTVQDFEEIYRYMLDGAIFTEGPPIPGMKRYLLFCLCSGAWFLSVLSFLLTRRLYPLYFVQFAFSVTPIWFVLYAFIKESAFYEYGSIWNFLIHQFVPSSNLLWGVASIAIALMAGRYCRSMRKPAS